MRFTKTSGRARSEPLAATLLSALMLAGLGARVEARTPTQGVEQLLADGSELIELGRYEEAEEVLRQAVERAPESAVAYSVLGQAQALNRRWLRAEDSLRQARELGQTDLQTLVFLGSALWENTRYDEAEAIYREAVERYPSSPFPKYQLGRLWLWQGRYDEAVPYLRQSAASNPAADVFFDLAEALRGAGADSEAIAAYEQALRRAPDLMKAHYGLALLYQKQGENDRAQHHLNQYSELYRLDQEAARTSELQRGEIDRGRALLQDDQTAEAIAHLSSLPPSVDGLTLLAEAYLKAGDSTQAIATLERAVVMDPGNSELRRRLSETRMHVESGGG